MSYLGNPPADRYTALSKQDITGNGGASYTLDYPVGSEAEIEVFVNHVRQEPVTSYTVSGTALTMGGNVLSTDDFYVVFQGKGIQTATHPAGNNLEAVGGTFTGNLEAVDGTFTGNVNVATIKDASGTNTALEIDSSGRVNMPNTVEIDQWRLTTSFFTDAATVTPFERVDDASFSKVGTGMTHSSGVFTFPTDGLYKVTTMAEIHASTTDNIAALEIMVSSDSGSNYDRVGYLSVGGTTGDNDRTGACAGVNVVNVTDASTFRFKLVTNSLGGAAGIYAHTDYNRTAITFERITDAQ